MCNNCQNYGHHKKWCKTADSVGRKCARKGLTMNECEEEQVQCVHCKETHMTGSREWERQKKEELLISIQDKEKVSPMRARQIFEGFNEYHDNVRERFSTYYDCRLDEADKRKFTAWLLEKCLANCIGSTPVSIRSTSKAAFTVEVNSKQQASSLNSFTNINGIFVKVTINDKMNVSKGLVYVYNYSMCDFEAFRKGLVSNSGYKMSRSHHG